MLCPYKKIYYLKIVYTAICLNRQNISFSIGKYLYRTGKKHIIIIFNIFQTVRKNLYMDFGLTLSFMGDYTDQKHKSSVKCQNKIQQQIVGKCQEFSRMCCLKFSLRKWQKKPQQGALYAPPPHGE